MSPATGHDAGAQRVLKQAYLFPVAGMARDYAAAAAVAGRRAAGLADAAAARGQPAGRPERPRTAAAAQRRGAGPAARNATRCLRSMAAPARRCAPGHAPPARAPLRRPRGRARLPRGRRPRVCHRPRRQAEAARPDEAGRPHGRRRGQRAARGRASAQARDVGGGPASHRAGAGRAGHPQQLVGPLQRVPARPPRPLLPSGGGRARRAGPCCGRGGPRRACHGRPHGQQRCRREHRRRRPQRRARARGRGGGLDCGDPRCGHVGHGGARPLVGAPRRQHRRQAGAARDRPRCRPPRHQRVAASRLLPGAGRSPVRRRGSGRRCSLPRPLRGVVQRPGSSKSSWVVDARGGPMWRRGRAMHSSRLAWHVSTSPV